MDAPAQLVLGVVMIPLGIHGLLRGGIAPWRRNYSEAKVAQLSKVFIAVGIFSLVVFAWANTN